MQAKDLLKDWLAKGLKVRNDARVISVIILVGIAKYYDVDVGVWSRDRLMMEYVKMYLSMWKIIEKELKHMDIDVELGDFYQRGLNPEDFGDSRDSIMLSNFGERWQSWVFTQGLVGKYITTNICANYKAWNSLDASKRMELEEVMKNIRKINEEYLKQDKNIIISI